MFHLSMKKKNFKEGSLKIGRSPEIHVLSLTLSAVGEMLQSLKAQTVCSLPHSFLPGNLHGDGMRVAGASVNGLRASNRCMNSVCDG